MISCIPSLKENDLQNLVEGVAQAILTSVKEKGGTKRKSKSSKGSSIMPPVDQNRKIKSEKYLEKLEKLKKKMSEKLIEGKPATKKDFDEIPEWFIVDLAKRLKRMTIHIDDDQGKSEMLGKRSTIPMSIEEIYHTSKKQKNDGEGSLTIQEISSQSDKSSIEEKDFKDVVVSQIEVDLYKEIGYEKLANLVKFLSEDLTNVMNFYNSRSLNAFNKIEELKEAVPKHMKEMEEFIKTEKKNSNQLGSSQSKHKENCRQLYESQIDWLKKDFDGLEVDDAKEKSLFPPKILDDYANHLRPFIEKSELYKKHESTPFFKIHNQLKKLIEISGTKIAERST